MKYSDDYRLKVAKAYCRTGNAKSISVKYDVPLKTVYRWGKALLIEDEAALNKKSTRPKSSPQKINNKIEDLVIKYWFDPVSKRKFSNVQRRLKSDGVDISAPTIKSILKRRKEI